MYEDRTNPIFNELIIKWLEWIFLIDNNSHKMESITQNRNENKIAKRKDLVGGGPPQILTSTITVSNPAEE